MPFRCAVHALPYDAQVGCSLEVEMPDELMDEAANGGHEMTYAWHRSKVPPDESNPTPKP